MKQIENKKYGTFISVILISCDDGTNFTRKHFGTLHKFIPHNNMINNAQKMRRTTNSTKALCKIYN